MREPTRDEVLQAAKRLRRLTPEEIENYELPPIPSEEEVKERIADYKRRVGVLFDQIEDWVAEDGRFSSNRSGVDYIFERYMAYYDLMEEEVPVLSIKAGDLEVLRFRPNGIWVVPTNGRIAIETPHVPPKRRLHSLRLLDQAQEIGKADWTLWGTSRDQFGTDVSFNKGNLLKLIRDQNDAIG